MSKFEIKEHWSVRSLRRRVGLRHAICLSDVCFSFSLAFHRQNLAFFPWNPRWNLCYIMDKTMFSLALSLPVDQSPAPYFGS